MSLTPKVIDHRDPYQSMLVHRTNERNKALDLLAIAEKSLKDSNDTMRYAETRFKHLQIGVAVFALTCFIAIAVEATIIVILLSR